MHLRASGEPVGRFKRDGSHPSRLKMADDLKNDLLSVFIYCKRLVDRRERHALVECDVHDRSDDLYYLSLVHVFFLLFFTTTFYFLHTIFYLNASAPDAISIIWLVIVACRDLLYWTVSPSPRSEALSEAFFIAARRAACSEAFASRMMSYTSISTRWGVRAVSTASGEGSIR